MFFCRQGEWFRCHDGVPICRCEPFQFLGAKSAPFAFGLRCPMTMPGRRKQPPAAFVLMLLVSGVSGARLLVWGCGQFPVYRLLGFEGATSTNLGSKRSVD
jgi:hypothetical protein